MTEELPRADPAGAAGLAARLAARHYGSILVLWFPAFLADLAADGTLLAYQRAAGLPADPAAFTLADDLRLLGVGIPIALAVVTLKLALFCVVAAFVLDRVAPADAPRLPRVARRAGPLLLLGVALAFAYLAGIVLLVVPFLVAFHWFQFAPAAFAEGGRGVGEAFEASRRFARERRAFGFTALVLFVAGGLVIVWLVAGGLLTIFLAERGLPEEPTQVVVGAFLSWLLTPIVAVFPAAYWALGMRAGPAAAPEPAGPAAERFRTTKCPQCGVLVPYQATGAPVEVECPSCGRKGKVA